MRLSLAEIARYMRMGREVPGGELAARVEALLPAATAAMSPRGRYARFAKEDVPLIASSARLRRALADCDEVFLACGTLGAAFDAWQRRVSVASGLDALIAQAIGAAAVEREMDGLGERMSAELGPGARLAPRYSPGYGDYPLAANRPILELLDAPRRMGVSVTDSHLLVPAKSVTAVVGIVVG